MELLRVGFVGLGTMGKPMARCVLRRGFPLTVYDVRSDVAADLARDGATAAASARDVAAASDITITMVPDSPDVRSAVLGKDGVLAGLRTGATLIEMSTI